MSEGDFKMLILRYVFCLFEQIANEAPLIWRFLKRKDQKTKDLIKDLARGQGMETMGSSG